LAVDDEPDALRAVSTILDDADRSLLDEVTACWSAACWERRRVKKFWRDARDESRRRDVRRESLERAASLEALLLRDGILHAACVVG
jgi:hypothetical protein